RRGEVPRHVEVEQGREPPAQLDARAPHEDAALRVLAREERAVDLQPPARKEQDLPTMRLQVEAVGGSPDGPDRIDRRCRGPIVGPRRRGGDEKGRTKNDGGEASGGGHPDLRAL